MILLQITAFLLVCTTLSIYFLLWWIGIVQGEPVNSILKPNALMYSQSMKNTNKKSRKAKRKQKKSPHFTFCDRVKIELLLSEHWSYSDIAKKLNKAKSSVSDEIKLNSVKGIYTAKKAHQKARQRRKKAWWQSMKIAMDAGLSNYVEEKIKRFWSPEDIAGRIKFIDKHIPYANKDSIYKYLKSVYGRQLIEFLWYRGKTRKPVAVRGDIKNRKFIDQRPKIVLKRRNFWDWEADFIVSGKHGKGALLVFIERKSRYVLIFKLHDRKVETINFILRSVFGSGQLLCSSLTIDNDVCFRHHKQMEKIIGAPIFFCHPYHSWEKGSVEKINQLIRRFIKKGCNIDKVSERRVRFVQDILNNKPYKCLGFFTPKEVLLRNRKLRNFVEDNFSKIVTKNLLIMQENYAKCSV